MERVVALLRGVNIGKRQLPMASLRAGLEQARCTDVATYVQSGNAVVTPPAAAAGDVPGWLTATISTIAGFDVPVVVRTASELATVVSAAPYRDVGATKLHVVFCASPPPALDVDLDATAPEHATVLGREVYLHLPDGMGRAKLPVVVGRHLTRSGIVATTRNWNTVEALCRLLDGRSGRANGGGIETGPGP